MEAATDVDKKKKRTREPESVGQQQQEQGGGMTDSFLSSMTFAAHGAALARGGCDCDECGGAGYIPQAIVDAIRRHKRLKNETAPIKRTQLRELLARQGPIAVYRFTMPLQAEPLVEFGTSHRLVWIKFLPDSSVLKAIGKGILGSQDEERGRKDLTSWKNDDLYLVPSNGGKAVAWIHSQKSNVNKDETAGQQVIDNSTGIPKSAGGHVIMYICKIPVEVAEINNEQSESASKKHCEEQSDEEQPEWDEILRKTCHDALKVHKNIEFSNNDQGMVFYKLSEEKSILVRGALSKL